MEIPEMVSLREASRRTGLSYDFLRALCLQGRIAFIRTGVKYLVNLGRLVDFLNNGGNERE